MEQPTTVTITTSDAYEARKMLDWYKYYSACEDIRQYIRNKLKYHDVSESEQRIFETIRDALPAEEFE